MLLSPHQDGVTCKEWNEQSLAYVLLMGGLGSPVTNKKRAERQCRPATART